MSWLSKTVVYVYVNMKTVENKSYFLRVPFWGHRVPKKFQKNIYSHFCVLTFGMDLIHDSVVEF